MTADNSYQLLDSGEGRKLEQVGPYLIDRQCAVAFWRKAKPALWPRVHAFHHRSETGGGHWEFKNPLPESWTTQHGELLLKTKLTAFGHLGFFAEQAAQWAWFRSIAQGQKSQVEGASLPRVLNLFAYTGGTSLSAALGKCDVTHVDAAKGVVDWAKQNAELNHIPDGRIRFIVDDCLTFLKREERRGKKYDAVVLDPPSYGRGPNKEIFKIEEHINGLLDAVVKVLVTKPLFVHFSSHSPGFTPIVLQNLLSERIDVTPMFIEKGEMKVLEQNAQHALREVPAQHALRYVPDQHALREVPAQHALRYVPSGAFCRISRPQSADNKNLE